MRWIFLVLSSTEALTPPGKTFYRRVGFDRVEFGGRLAVDSTLEASSAQFSEYLTPKRIVSAAWDPNMVQDLEDGVFRLTQEPVNFAGSELAISVDVAVVQKGSAMKLDSKDISCVITFNRRPQRLPVDISLDGRLLPQSSDPSRIQGSFDFTIKGKLVGPLLLLPDPALSAATGLVSLGIIRYAQNRFVNGVKSDFRLWQQQQQQQQLRRPH